MKTLNGTSRLPWRKSAISAVLLSGLTWGIVNVHPAGWADVYVNTGTAGSGTIIGSGNMQATETGIGVNGDVSNSSLNNNQNNVSSDNRNMNYVQPIVLSAPNTSGNGGNSAIIMPRNPLNMPNAALGRSNFGLQFGVQNNPGVASTTGGGSALGWFMQGGVTIPFGKVPDVYKNPQANRLDESRLGQLERQRNVFGSAQPQAASNNVGTSVQGKVLGLNAYNYTPMESGKMALQDRLHGSPPIGEIVMPQPKVLALEPADVFTQPINTGKKIGLIEVGKEYAYLGHTRSGWVKVLLPNGTEGWATTRFEYIKHDYTEIDTLAVDTIIGGQKKVAVKAQNAKGGG